MQIVQSIIDSGNGATLVRVECSISNSLPAIVIVGFTHRSVDEARERIRGALATNKIPLPRKRITLNLAPADIPKQGSSFDLPMLVAILAKANMLRLTPNSRTVIIGEVGMDGSIRPVRGIIGKILAAKKLGVNQFWIPADNVAQASLIPGVTLYAFQTVGQLYSQLNKSRMPPSVEHYDITQQQPEIPGAVSGFDDIVGQHQAKRALLVAAAGHHNIMLNGPPGTGKSMLGRCLPSIIPDLTMQELLDVTQLHSLISKNFDKIITKPPFRTPHHSASTIAMLGGGQQPRPGEISLSHRGVLMLDEFPEFNKRIIEALRQPLEERTISIARSRDTIEFPAHFLMVATANPCPCGYYDSEKPCICTPMQVLRYQKKLSGPIVDRIDMYLTVEPVPHAELLTVRSKPLVPDNSKQRVAELRAHQRLRAGKLNSELSNSELKQFARPDPAARQLLNQAATQMKLSARGYIRALRVARTIADLEDSTVVSSIHISEALQYRPRTSTS